MRALVGVVVLLRRLLAGACGPGGMGGVRRVSGRCGADATLAALQNFDMTPYEKGPSDIGWRT